jgi:hypothetical protein
MKQIDRFEVYTTPFTEDNVPTLRPVAAIKHIIGKTNRAGLLAMMNHLDLRPPAKGGYVAMERHLGSLPRRDIERVLALVRRQATK